MKQYSAFLILVFVLVFGGSLLCTSCKSSSGLTQETTETNRSLVVTKTEHDSVFRTPAETTKFTGQIEIIDGKAKIISSETTKSKSGVLQPPKLRITDKTIECDCEAREQELHAKWQSENRQQITETTRKIPYPVPRELTWWQTTQIWAGRIFLLIVLIYAVVKIIKSYIPV